MKDIFGTLVYEIICQNVELIQLKILRLSMQLRFIKIKHLKNTGFDLMFKVRQRMTTINTTKSLTGVNKHLIEF